MTTQFDLVTEDFKADLTAISDLVAAVESSTASPKARIAAIRSSILLLAATFEEYVREMAREYARGVVTGLNDPQRIPRKISATAWKRTLESLARAKIDTGGKPMSLDHVSNEARAKFKSICDFLAGDLSQDIYQSLIYNENNMRPGEINSAFSVSDLKNVCEIICSERVMKEYYQEEDAGKVHGAFVVEVNDFMEKRNTIAHALNAGNSIGADDFHKTVELMEAFSSALAASLSLKLPNALTVV